MKKNMYEELMQEIEYEKTIAISFIENVVNYIIQQDLNEEEDEEEGFFDYSNSSRKRLCEIARLFENKIYHIEGVADEFHNCAVSYARVNMYNSACIILKNGLEKREASVDLLADFIKYGIFCGKQEECEGYYKQLEKISKKEWNWRAFTFSIDFLLDKLEHTVYAKDRNNIKKKLHKLADEFILKIGSDQAYFDKAKILRMLGTYNGDSEESILQKGIELLLVTPRCALRMADILFERGEYGNATELLARCCINAFKPQPDINGSYSFLLSAMSKTSKLFTEFQKEDFVECKDVVLDIYCDINTAIESGLDGIYRSTANTAIKIIAAQTAYEYPYLNADDPFDL